MADEMTGEQFDDKCAAELEFVPPEFHTALNQMAWDHGHSAGREEVVNCLMGLVSDLRSSIAAYGKRIAREARKTGV